MKLDSLITKLKDVAEKSNMKIKLAAGLFYSKKGFVTTGCNTTRTYSKNSLLPSEHAECAALRELRKFPNINCKDLKLVVIRIGLSGDLLQSTPCINCATTIYSHGIRKIYYINEKNKIVCQRTHELCTHHKKSIDKHLTQTNIWFENVSNNKSEITNTIKLLERKIKDPFFNQFISEKIIHCREIQKLSKKDLSIRLCLPLSTITMIENKTLSFNPAIYSKLVRFFGFHL
jgi:tRNA(Arg) A34 adenosine deaminase TadA